MTAAHGPYPRDADRHFPAYDDSFTGRYNGMTIRATHTWSEDRRTRRSEDCVFTEINGFAT